MAGHRSARVAIAVLALGALGPSRRAAAQPAEPAGEGDVAPAKDPKAMKKWAALGQVLMQRGSYLAARHRLDDAKQQFENAATAYRKALEMGDDINLYLELALAEDKAGRLDGAVKHLRRVASAQPGVRPDVAKRATAKLEELLARVGLVTLTVTPPGTSITLGGTELGLSPLAEPLVLMPGTYALAFQADGFQPREAELKVEPGSESERSIELEPVKVIVEPVQPAVVEEAARVEVPVRRSRLPLYAGTAVTLAAAAGAAILGTLAIRQHTTFTRRATSPADRADAQANGKLLALLADGAGITAAAAAGFTAYWYFYRYRQRLTNSSADRRSNPRDSPSGRHWLQMHTKLDVVPWVQPKLGGMTIAGWF
jgi:hypothetical protein